MRKSLFDPDANKGHTHTHNMEVSMEVSSQFKKLSATQVTEPDIGPAKAFQYPRYIRRLQERPCIIAGGGGGEEAGPNAFNPRDLIGEPSSQKLVLFGSLSPL